MKFALLILGALTTGEGLAQDTASVQRDTTFLLPPVTVNPIEAHERLTPVTFSNLNRLQLSERYSTQDVPLLLSELPSVTFYSENGNGIGYNYINLRGFDQRRISVMINGVPQNDPEDHNVYWIDFPDLLGSTENIQVQRGAGSAFYGPPAIGGSVNLISTPFDLKPSVALQSLFGFQEYGSQATAIATRKYDATINSGLIDRQYLLYGRLGKTLSDGYRENSWAELNSYFLGAVRFDKDMTTRLHLFGGPLEDGLSYLGLPKFVNEDEHLRRANWGDWNADSSWVNYSEHMSRVVSLDLHDTVYAVTRRNQEAESFSQPHYELLHEWRLSPGVTLHNTLFYYTGEGYFDYDASWADTSLLRIGYTYNIPASQNPGDALVRAFVGNKQWGWLPRIELDHGAGTLTLGAELRIHRSTHWGKIQFAENLPDRFDPDYHFYEYNGEKEILSAYAHELYRLNGRWTLMTDLQLVHNRYGLLNEKYLGTDFSVPYLFANPRAGVNVNLTEEWNWYLSVAYTSREPRLSNLYAAEESYYGATPQFRADTSGGVLKYDYANPLAQPEHLLDLELGTGFRNPSAAFSVNLYWMEFTNELVENGLVDIFGQPVTGNAERTRHVGLELDGTVSVIGGLSFSGNLSLSSNKLIRHLVYVAGYDTAGNQVLAPTSLDDNPIAGFPDILSNARITYRTHDLNASLAGKYVGSFYTDNFKDESNKNDSYVVFDGTLLYRLPLALGVGFNLRGEVRNIFNRLYFSNGIGNAFFPAAERSYLIGITAIL